MLRVRVGELGEEDPLRALNQVTVNNFTAAKRGGPERKIEDVVQTKRAKHAQDEAVQQSPQIAGGIHQPAEAKDQLLKMRPDHGHQRADEYRHQ